MDTNSDIRNKIIIFDEYPHDYLKEYSDLELAGIYSNNKNNFEIFEKLLYEKRNESQLITILLIKIIMHVKKRANIDAVKLLIRYGADVNAINSNKLTLLMLCYFFLQNNIEILELLIENGADVNIKNSQFQTTLMYSLRNVSSYDKLEIFKLFVRKENQINSKDVFGDTALMIYIRDNGQLFIRYDIIKLLLDNKASIYIKNNKGVNIFNYLEERFGKQNYKNSDIYSLIFNYKNLHGDHFCEYDINFFYNYF